VNCARRAGIAVALCGLALLGGCASAAVIPAELTQAQSIYASLETQHAEQHVEGDMIRARAAIDTARAAVTQRENDLYVAGQAEIAFRTVQIAEAHFGRAIAQIATDSLQRLKLTRQLAAAQARQAALESQREELERKAAAANARADSLRRAADAANAQLEQAMGQLQSLVVEITDLKQTSRGLVISLSDILFDLGQASLKPGADANIRKISAVLKQYPDHQISIEGYTDSTGSDAFNQQLSENRARAVRDALVAGGLDSTAIAVHGYGKANPVATNTTPDGRQQNRRVEIVVLGAGKLADLMQARSPASVTTTDTTASSLPKLDTLTPPSAVPTPSLPDYSARGSPDSTRHR
jgi:outer membrane protein OmpA-like peptidoglycan-associated protein